MDRFIDEEETICLYEPALKEDDVETEYPSFSDKELLVDEDGQRYGRGT